MSTTSRKVTAPNTNANNNLKQSTNKPEQSDEKKDTEDLNTLSSLNTLFEQYRIVQELAFNITKQEKSNKLNDIKKQIETLIASIDKRYNYRQTLNIDNSKNTPHKKGHKKDTNNKTEIENKENINHLNIINSSASANSTGALKRGEYLYIIGRYYYICGALTVAMQLLQESVKLEPELIECWNTLGDIYYNRNDILASKFCFQSALEYDRYNKISYISLSKILRKPTGKDQMEIMENCIESLILAKQALKYSKNSASNNKNALKDGELWFNLGNAYLMTFLNCINGFKLDSSLQLEKEQKNEMKHNNSEMNNPNTNNILSELDLNNYFSEEYEQAQIYKEIRREIESELNDSQNNLLFHVYIKKCLSSYKCASTKCVVNKHSHHPDLYCNRSHIHIFQQNYALALQDLKLSIKYASIENSANNESDTYQNSENIQAKKMHNELLPKLCKISKQISNKNNGKMAKKLVSFGQQISACMKQSSDYYTRQLHYDLVSFAQLSEGLNGGNVIVIKVLHLMQPSHELPLHFVVCDSCQSTFVLSFYLRGHALNHIYKIINQMGNVINTQTLICVANPIKRHIKFNHGSKHIDFHTISFQKPQDICIGGKFFFNQ